MSALLNFDGTREDLAVVVSYAAPTGPFVWLMPLPATPGTAQTPIGGLIAGFRITTPPLESAYQSQPYLGSGGAAPPKGVLELGRTTIGNLEFVTLGGTDAAEVATWMRSHGFAFHDTQRETVQAYLAKHWVLVAARTIAGSTPPNGAIAVRFTFPTTDPVYPLAIAGASHRGTLPMQLLVTTPYRPASATYPETTVVPASNGQEPSPTSRLELRYASLLTEAERMQVGHTIAVPAGYCLTRYDAAWQVTDLSMDLVLNRADNQSKVNFDQLYKRFQLQQDRANRDSQRLQLAIVGTILSSVAGLVAFGIILVAVLTRGYRRRR